MIYMVYCIYFYFVYLVYFEFVFKGPFRITQYQYNMLICLRAVFIFIYILAMAAIFMSPFVRDERHLILRQVLEDDGNKHIDVVRTGDDDRNLETCFHQKKIKDVEGIYWKMNRNQINCKLPGHQKRSSNFLVPRFEKGRPRDKKPGEIRGVVRLRRKHHEWVGGFSTTSFATKAAGFYWKAHQFVWREVLRTGRSVKDHTAGTLQQIPRKER